MLNFRIFGPRIPPPLPPPCFVLAPASAVVRFRRCGSICSFPLTGKTCALKVRVRVRVRHAPHSIMSPQYHATPHHATPHPPQPRPPGSQDIRHTAFYLINCPGSLVTLVMGFPGAVLPCKPFSPLQSGAIVRSCEICRLPASP